MGPSRRNPRIVFAAAVIALIVTPEFAVAQQPSTDPTPPRQIGNRTDYKELQPTTAEICGSGGKETVDCSPRSDQELDNIRRQLDKPARAHPQADDATTPPNGTR